MKRVPEEDIPKHPNFIRGQWMLKHQIHSANDLIRFWAIYGAYSS